MASPRTSVYGPPLEGREVAARRWRTFGWLVLAAGSLGGLVITGAWAVDLDSPVMVVGLVLAAIGVVGAFILAVGVGWTRGISGGRPVWLGLKAAGAAIWNLF